jgi:SAM-dependent methyltransferase
VRYGMVARRWPDGFAVYQSRALAAIRWEPVDACRDAPPHPAPDARAGKAPGCEPGFTHAKLSTGGHNRQVRDVAKKDRMFTKSQRFYDAIYNGKDYAGEARRLKQFIADHKRSAGHALLDVACGTGGHAPYLRDDFAYEGLDLDPGMLELARARYPDVPFYRGNMVDFDLGRSFDVVTCLFSSIAYTRTVPRLRQAIANMARHLRPGGVLVIGPFIAPGDWIPGQPHAIFVDQPDLKLARMNVSSVDASGTVAILDFHYLVATPDGVTHFIERHELGLFTGEDYRTAFAQAGLDVFYDAEGLIGRGQYIGTRPFA